MKGGIKRIYVQSMGLFLAAVSVGTAFMPPIAVRADSEASDYERAVDLMAEEILLLDEAGVLFEEGLDEVRAYLDGEGDLKDLRVSLPETAEKIEEIALEAVAYVSPDDAGEVLEACGIDQEEYDTFVGYLGDDIDCIATDLSYLYQLYLYDYTDAEVEAYLDEFRDSLEDTEDFWEAKKGYYYYYYVNYWFAEWGETETSLVEENLLSKLSAFNGDGMEWKTDRDAAEEEIVKYLDQIEEYNRQFQEETAKKEEELSRLQQAQDESGTPES